MTGTRVGSGGTLILDSEGLAKVVSRDSSALAWLTTAAREDLRVATSAATVVEVMHPRIRRAALDWTLSRIIVEPVTGEVAQRAARLLAKAGLHGHKYAIDAMLSATALGSQAPIIVLTSDPDDLAVLCGPAVTIVKI
ncbi:MAG TPA: PIN domain-containing protein [Kineosporiaceae bacterium]|nr:PIN domain-containing protein [Kineosporiaceae bacterium]